jgi:hypothetical protein
MSTSGHASPIDRRRRYPVVSGAILVAAGLTLAWEVATILDPPRGLEGLAAVFAWRGLIPTVVILGVAAASFLSSISRLRAELRPGKLYSWARKWRWSFRVDDVVKAFGASRRDVSKVLSALVKSGHLEQRKRGRYIAVAGKR